MFQLRRSQRSRGSSVTLVGLLCVVLGGLVSAFLVFSQPSYGQEAPISRSSSQLMPYPDRYEFLPAIVNVPAPTPLPPKTVLFLGQEMVWDGEGYITLDTYQVVGTHTRRNLDTITAPDIVRSNNHSWYSPNPNGWEDDYWYSYYRLSTGEFLSSSAISDPMWKFAYPWVMPAGWMPQSGEALEIDGEPFSVTGPIDGVTAFGKPIRYWRMENNETILYLDDNSGWNQQVRPGDMELHFDAGESRLLLFSDVLRSVYHNGSTTAYSIRYISMLTGSNAFRIGRKASPISVQGEETSWPLLSGREKVLSGALDLPASFPSSAILPAPPFGP